MGSFYSTCSLSNMTIIDGQQTSIQLLISRNYKHTKDLEIEINEDGSMLKFLTFGFPIHGKYADYGQIDDIKRDDNIKILEKYFNISIDEILSFASGRMVKKPEKIHHEDLLEKMELTFFRTEIYDKMCEGWSDLDETKKSSWGNRFPDMWKYFKQQAEIGYHSHWDLMSLIKSETDEEKVKLYKHHITNYIQEYTYFPRYVENFYKLLNIDIEKFKDEFKKQVKLSEVMRNLHIVFRPSWYGTQEDNYVQGYLYHKNILNQITTDIKEMFNDDYFEEEDIENNKVYKEIFYQEKQQLRLNKLQRISETFKLEEEQEFLEKRLKEIKKKLK